MGPVNLEQKSKHSKVLLTIILGMLVGLCIFIYYDKSIFLSVRRLFTGQIATNYKVLAHICYDPEQKPIFATFDNKVLQVTKDGVKALNIAGEVEWEHKLNLSSPYVLTNNKYILIADKTGSIYLYQGNKKIWNKVLDGEIVNAKLGKNGHALIIKESQGIRELLVLNASGSYVLNKSYQDKDFLVNADISSDNKKVAVVSIYTQKDVVSSKIEWFELRSTTAVNSVPVCAFCKEGTLAIDIKLFNNSNIVLITDNATMGLDVNGNNKWIKEFSNLKIFNTNISSGNYIVLEANSTGINTLIENKSREIHVLNGNGIVEGENIKTAKVVNMDIFENYFLIYDGTKVYSISRGKVIWSCPLAKDIKYIKGFLGKSQIMLVGRDSIDIVSVN